MKHTWRLLLLKCFHCIIFITFVLVWYNLVFQPGWKLPSFSIVFLLLAESVYSWLLHKFTPEEERQKPNPLFKVVILVMIAVFLLSGLYRLWQLG